MRINTYISTFSETFADYWYEIKTVAYLLFAFLNIDIDIVKTLSVLMIIDTSLGVLKSIFLKELKFTFRKLLWGIVSKSTILLIPMLLALVSMGLGYDFKWIVDAVLKILIISETISALTNIISIKEERLIENTDYISKLLNAVRNFFINTMDRLLRKFEQ